MHTHICTCVHVCTCIPEYTHEVHACPLTYTCAFARIYTHMHKHTHMYTHAYIHTCMHSQTMHTCAYAQIYTCMHMHVCTHSRKHVFIHKHASNCFVLFKIYLFLAVLGLRCCARASGGYSSLRCVGFSLRWLLLLRSMGSRHVGFSSCGMRAQ